MKREEQIKEASIDFQIATNPRCIAGEAFADFAREMNVNKSFIEGAKWADETMIEKAISKCALMLLNIDELLRKKGLKGQFEEEFDTEYKKFRKAMEE